MAELTLREKTAVIIKVVDGVSEGDFAQVRAVFESWRQAGLMAEGPIIRALAEHDYPITQLDLNATFNPAFQNKIKELITSERLIVSYSQTTVMPQALPADTVSDASLVITSQKITVEDSQDLVDMAVVFKKEPEDCNPPVVESGNQLSADQEEWANRLLGKR